MWYATGTRVNDEVENVCFQSSIDKQVTQLFGRRIATCRASTDKNQWLPDREKVMAEITGAGFRHFDH